MTCRSCSRREFIAQGLYGLGIGAGLPLILGRTSAALAAQALQGTSVEKHPERILVVVELSGGNDGLNTVVPFGDPAYYRARPRLGIPEREAIKIAPGFGFHPSMVGFERLYKDGLLAVVHGCGYENPSLSHFSSMGYWHTGVPNGGEPLGWLGRLADATYDASTRNLIVDIGNQQSLAVRSRKHSPLVFSDPERFRREGTDTEKHALLDLSRPRSTTNATLEFLAATAQNAAESSDFVRQAAAGYRTPVDYGIGGGLGGNLQRVAALIAAGIPTRLFYVTYQGNSFDTHVQQADLHSRLLMYTADAINGFLADMKRLGRADQVAVMIFTEFGRRVEENGSLGTDHGTATPMFIAGAGVKGGLHGTHPSLTDLDDGNLKMTTDFRRVYATMIDEWLGYDDTRTVLKGRFEPAGAPARAAEGHHALSDRCARQRPHGLRRDRVVGVGTPRGADAGDSRRCQGVERAPDPRRASRPPGRLGLRDADTPRTPGKPRGETVLDRRGSGGVRAAGDRSPRRCRLRPAAGRPGGRLQPVLVRTWFGQRGPANLPHRGSARWPHPALDAGSTEAGADPPGPPPSPC
jgi:uncharacterized protein (DUF1501 family)